MGKDPAVLWYWGDWGGGTRTLPRHAKGCYMDLMEAQFNSADKSLTIDEIKTVLHIDFEVYWPMLEHKFILLTTNKYQNERLYKEILRRQKYGESRRSNAKGNTNKPAPELIYREFGQLYITKEEVEKLKALNYNDKQINEILDAIQNYKKNVNYVNLFLTAKQWLKKEYNTQAPGAIGKTKRNTLLD